MNLPEELDQNDNSASPAIAARTILQGGKAVKFVCFIAALVAAFSLGYVPLHASFGGDRLRVVAFGDSLLDAGTYSPYASKEPFNGGGFNPTPGTIINVFGNFHDFHDVTAA